MEELEIFKRPIHKYCIYYIEDNEKLLKNVIHDFMKNYILCTDKTFKYVQYSDILKGIFSDIPKCIIIGDDYHNNYDTYKDIFFNNRHYYASVILKYENIDIPLYFRVNIDYLIMSKNTKQLDFIFKKIIKLEYPEISFSTFLKYFEKYEYLIFGYDTHYKPKLYRYITQDSAARIIQKGCHNWLYSPKCKDGTIGIVPRLGFKGNF